MLASLARLGRSMWVLLAGVFAFHAGWYLILPFLAVLLTDRRGLSPSEVGVVLAAHSLTLLLGSLLGGLLADSYGRKMVMVVGLGLRAAGLVLFGFAGGFMPLLLTVGLAGFGGGLYGPAAKAAIAVVAPKEERASAFSLRGIAANVGVSIGPLVGSLLVGGSMPLLFGTAAAVQMVMGILTWVYMGTEHGEERQERAPLRNIFRDIPYVAFSMAMVLAWALHAQLAISMPLYARQVLGLEASIGLLWTISSVAVILFQLAVTRFVTARLHPFSAMAIGVLLMGIGLGVIGLAGSFWGLVGAVLVWVLGTMFLVPTADSAVSLMAQQGAVGSYFGLSSFAWGLGEGAGALIGGGLMEAALEGGRVALPWIIYGATGAVVAVIFFAIRRWNRMRTALREATAQERRRVHAFRPGHPISSEDGVLLGPEEE